MSRRAMAAVLAALGVAAGTGCGGGEDAERQASASGAPPAAAAAAASEIGEAARADAGGAEGEPDTGFLDDLPEEGVGSKQVTCPPGPPEVTSATVAQAAQAVLCLHNAERTARGLKPLKLNPKLAKAAAGHARDMVAAKYFAHDSQDGRKFDARIRAAGYMSRARRWTVGENLAWGGGARALPEAIMKGWMDSAPHRANVLDPAFREVGFAVALGTPQGGAGATYTAEYGVRK